MVQNINISINKNNMQSILSKGIEEKALSENENKILLSLSEDTNDSFQKNITFTQIKQKIENSFLKLDNKKDCPIKDYLEAYENILEARTFFLGPKGIINYTFLVSINNKISEINIGSKTFKQLLLGHEDQILRKDKDSLRFRRAGLVANLLPNLVVNAQEYKLTLQDGTEVHIESATSFNKQMNEIKSIAERFFGFNIKIHIAPKSYHLEILSANGGADVQTVYSAVGKYAYDELDAKKESIKLNNLEGTISTRSINIGNLSEIYALYKNRYNKGHNHWETTTGKKYRYVTGKELFPIFKQVRQNTDAFYQGGDILQNQIKSFLKDAPSLTRLSTLKVQIERLYKILNKTDKEEIKENIKEMFIKKKPDINSTLYKKESALIDQLEQYLKALQF